MRYEQRPAGRHAPLRLIGGLLVAAGLLFGPARAAEAPYRIHQGDRIAVAIYGAPEQSGEYPVNVDGAMTHPLAGDIDAAGRTVAALREDLAGRLGAYLPSPVIAVSVTAHAPVFVVGDVARSGEYDFRPGMTALQLLAMAGGERRDILPARDSGLAIIAAERDYADLSLRIFSGEVAAARFQAEMGGGAFSFDARPPAVVPRADAEFIVGNERRLFDLRRAARASEDRGLRAQGENYETEIGMLEKSIALHDTELSLLDEDVKAAEALVARGLSTPSRLRDIQRTRSAMLRDALELQTALARARQGRLDIERRLNDAAATFRSAAGDGLRATEIQLASLRLSRDAVERSLAAHAAAADPSRPAARAPALEFSVLRAGADGMDERIVGENERLEPGDVMRVSRRAADSLSPRSQ